MLLGDKNLKPSVIDDAFSFIPTSGSVLGIIFRSKLNMVAQRKSSIDLVSSSSSSQLSADAQNFTDTANLANRTKSFLAHTKPAVRHAALDPAATLLKSVSDTSKAYAQFACALVTLTAADEATTVKVGSLRQISDVGCDEVAALLNVSPTSARNQVNDARLLVRDLEQVLIAVSQAELTVGHTRALIDGWRQVVNARFSEFKDSKLRKDASTYYQSRLLEKAKTATLANLRRSIRLVVSRLISDSAHAAHEAAKLERQVTISPAHDGMSWVSALLTNSEAASIDHVLERLAREHQADGSIQTKRADLFVGLLTGNPDYSEDKLGLLASIEVVVGIDTLLELNDDAALIRGTQLTLTAQAIRRLAIESPLRRLVAEPLSGHLLECGRQTYSPPRSLRRKVLARDEHCRAPGCSRPAQYCDVDHVQPWRDGGETNETNLAVLCRRHHILKTAKGHAYEFDSKARVRWTMPSGRIFVTEPADYRPYFSDPPTF
jgi:hypothetical protein